MRVAGCARVVQPAPAPRAVMVKIPVATPIYCQIPALQNPPLAIASLSEDSAPADTIRSYVATVDILKSAVRERDTILKGCGAPTVGAAGGELRAVNVAVSVEPNPRPLPSREGEQSIAKQDERVNEFCGFVGQ